MSAALSAEAAVLTRQGGARPLLRSAARASAGNPIALALTRRAEAILTGDVVALKRLAEDFVKSGTPYQQARTLRLARAV